MARKPTKKGLTRKLDAICSEITRSKGICEKCGRTENLQTHHVYGRAGRRLRWDLRNLVCLCPACHLTWAEAHPLDFTDWFREVRAEDAHYLQEEMKKGPRKWTLEEMTQHHEWLSRQN